MADSSKAVPGKKKISIPPLAIVIGLVILAGGAGLLYLEYQSRQGPPPPPVLTGDAKAYVRNLKLSDVDMKAHESYLKQSVVEITGNIGNQGNRVLDLVEINCVFYDAYGQLVLRERVPIVGRKTGALAPGETKPFRLAFDDIPESWNQAMPQLVIAQIIFK